MKYFGNIIAILVIVGLVYGIINFKDSPAYYNTQVIFMRLTSGMRGFINRRKHNIGMEMNPTRRPPLTFIEIESALGLWAPEIFGPLTDEDWKECWDLIYGQIDIKQGRFTVKGYRSRQEIQSYLRYKYRNFSYLREPDWSELWGIARVSF